VRPSATRDAPTYTVNLLFTVSEGQRAYIERINIRREYARTRELRDPTRNSTWREGDAYNRAAGQSGRAAPQEPQLFQICEDNRPNPARPPDRVVLNVDLEEQATGEFSVSGGYSTADGFMGEVSVAERNLLGRGLFGKVAVQYGQYTKGLTVSYVDFFLTSSVIAWHGVSTPSTGNSFRPATSRTRRIRSALPHGSASRCAKTSPYSCDIRSISRKSYWRRT